GVDFRVVAEANGELEVMPRLPLVLNVRAGAPAIRDGTGVVGRIGVEEADADAPEVGKRARVRGESEEPVPITGQPAVSADAGQLDTAGDDVPAVAECARGTVDEPDVRLLEDEREACRAEGDAG